MSRIGYLERYLETSADILRQLPLAAIDGVIGALVQALEAERFVYVMGNGAARPTPSTSSTISARAGCVGFRGGSRS